MREVFTYEVQFHHKKKMTVNQPLISQIIILRIILQATATIQKDSIQATATVLQPRIKVFVKEAFFLTFQILCPAL